MKRRHVTMRDVLHFSTTESSHHSHENEDESTGNGDDGDDQFGHYHAQHDGLVLEQLTVEKY